MSDLNVMLTDAMGKGAVALYQGKINPYDFLPNQDLSAYYAPTALLNIPGCGDDDTTEDMMIDIRFESELVGMDDMEILIDTETNLVWVNDIRGCFAGIINPEMECGMLVFAGRDDWRTPTSAEMSALISAIAEREMELNYINSACSLMSTSDGVWVFTENTDMPGGTTMMMPGNAGLRCVAMN